MIEPTKAKREGAVSNAKTGPEMSDPKNAHGHAGPCAIRVLKEFYTHEDAVGLALEFTCFPMDCATAAFQAMQFVHEQRKPSDYGGTGDEYTHPKTEPGGAPTETLPDVADLLHPLGKCECGGEGICKWCTETARRERPDVEGARSLSADFINVNPNCVRLICDYVLRLEAQKREHILGECEHGEEGAARDPSICTACVAERTPLSNTGGGDG